MLLLDSGYTTEYSMLKCDPFGLLKLELGFGLAYPGVGLLFAIVHVLILLRARN